MEIDVEPEHLFSLEDCSNLSELTLDMACSESCPIQDCIYILSTLDPARPGGLGNIVLEARYVGSWFNKDGQADGEKDWKGLDAVLSQLAKASISERGERLTFTLVVVGWLNNYELMSTVRKWLPGLLPRFNELGSLHVHYGRDCHCRGVNGNCLPQDESD
jgi:hypothetical protein